MPPESRLLPLVGAFNFRDLGGYPTTDGKVTRWGRLYRSDTLHELTGSDLEVLREIGLATVIDLRTGAELEGTGRGLLADEPVRFVHLPVMEVEAIDDGPPRSLAELELASLYLGWLRSRTPVLVDALAVIGDPENHPLVFHCAAGKDRTGVLAALVLDILGVERHVIVEDYVVTASRLDLIRGRQRGDAEMAKRMAEAPHLFAVEGATMERFLAGLDDEHGGGRGWALAAGVPAESLDALTEILVE